MWSQSLLSAALLLVLPSPELASPLLYLASTFSVGSLHHQPLHPVYNNGMFQPSVQAPMRQPRSPCKVGVKVPHNFIEDTRPCPEGFRCQAWNYPYMSTINKLKTRKTYLETKFVQGLTCDAKSSPEDNNNPLISAKNIVKTYQRPLALCTRNPCPRGK